MPSRYVIADCVAAVDRYAGSYMYRVGSSSRRADDGNTPPSIGTVTVFPVRSSVMVMVSGTWLPPWLLGRISGGRRIISGRSRTITVRSARGRNETMDVDGSTSAGCGAGYPVSDVTATWDNGRMRRLAPVPDRLVARRVRRRPSRSEGRPDKRAAVDPGRRLERDLADDGTESSAVATAVPASEAPPTTPSVDRAAGHRAARRPSRPRPNRRSTEPPASPRQPARRPNRPQCSTPAADPDIPVGATRLVGR